MAAVTSAVIGGGVALGSGLAAANASSNASKRAARTTEAAAQRFYDIEDPDYQKMQLKFEEFKREGLITPEMEAAIEQDPSLLMAFSDDPSLDGMEMDALNRLSDISKEGGMDAKGAATMEAARMQTDASARGKREANLMNFAARGQGGNGLEFVSNQMADQDAANQNSLMGLNAAAEANDRELAALEGLSNLSNTRMNRQFGQEEAKASAQDSIDRFNTETRQGVSQRNVDRANNAQVANVAEDQRVADENVKLRNSAQTYNKSLEQTKFDNAMGRAQGAGGLAAASSAAQTAAGQGTANVLAGLGQSALKAGTEIYANSPYEKDKKKEG